MYVWARLARVVLTARRRGPYRPGGESRLSFRCLPTDIDPNIHLNNARYLMLADLGRLDLFFRSGLMRLNRERGWAPMMGGVQSVFVRENVPPSASVMVKLKRGRQLSESQVRAIVNLVAGSVPGLSIDAVRVVDQHGRLLSEASGADGDRLELQQRMEEKLRQQVAQLLTPMLGEGNFSSEIQVDLDMDQVTSARESYDKEGALRSESQSTATRADAQPAIGVPGVLANSPPPPAQLAEGAPQGTPPVAQPGATFGESSARRNFELGREVAVSSSRPGAVRRISSAAATGVAPGRVDSPPTSISAAPAATIASAWRNAASGVKKRPPSEKESGVTLRMPMTRGSLRSSQRPPQSSARMLGAGR